MEMPSVSHYIHAVPRAGGEGGEYEDAAALEANAWPVCAAVADGATESVFAQQWARLLVQGLTEASATTAEGFVDVIPDLQSEWSSSVSSSPEQQPWYVAAKMADGAFATALVLSLHPDGTWRAVSVGDCCLFHVRADTLQESWPFEASEAFTNRPALVSSQSDRPVPPPKTTTGTWAPNDTFLLATDAVASWLLRGTSGAWRETDPEAFQQKVRGAQEEEVLRNDDVTLLVLETEEVSLPNTTDSASE